MVIKFKNFTNLFSKSKLFVFNKKATLKKLLNKDDNKTKTKPTKQTVSKRALNHIEE